MKTRTFTFFLLSLFVIDSVSAKFLPDTRQPKIFSFLESGGQCDDCPPHFCNDDPAIILGFCCGCANFLDALPISCDEVLECPLDNYDLCEDYEYMLNCCC